MAHRAIVAISAMVLFASCAEEQGYIRPSSDKSLSNGLARATLMVDNQGDNLFSIEILLDSTEIKVENFGVTTTEDIYTFSDNQSANSDWKGELKSIELVSIDSIKDAKGLKITPNYMVKYSVYEEEREDILSPYYYQVVEAPALTPEVADVVEYIPEYQLVDNGKSVTLYFTVVKTLNGAEVDRWTAQKRVAQYSNLNGCDIYVLNAEYNWRTAKTDTAYVDSIGRCGKDKAFQFKEKQLIQTRDLVVNSTTGGEINRSNQLYQTLVDEVIFDAEGQYIPVYITHNVSSSTTFTQKDDVTSSKSKEGAEYIYKGSVGVEFACTIFSEQAISLNGKVAHQTSADFNLYVLNQ